MPDVTLRSRLEQYAAMQKGYYESEGGLSPKGVVGSYDYHENYPYETFLLFEYGAIRRPIYPNFATLRAFDIACGEGRMVRRMSKFFDKVDGADISSSMVEEARAQTPGSEFWVTNGLNAGDAPSDSYDFAFCTISLQHICVFSTRDLIHKDVFRILKPGAKATFQMMFSKNYPFVPTSPPVAAGGMGMQPYRIDSHHARWYDDKTEAIGTDELDAVKAYFLQFFRRVEFWFADISIGRSWDGEPRILPETHPNSHGANDYLGTHFIFIHCDGLMK